MGDDWVPGQPGDIDVEINDLYQFVWSVAVDRGTLDTEWAAGPGLLLETDANLGGFLRALTDFGASASIHRMALGAFMMEVGLGFDALAMGTAAIADEYGGTDAYSAASLDSVNRAFTPPQGVDTEQIVAEYDGRFDGTSEQNFDDLVEQARENPDAAFGPGLADDQPRWDQTLGAGTAGEYIVQSDGDGVLENQIEDPAANELHSAGGGSW